MATPNKHTEHQSPIPDKPSTSARFRAILSGPGGKPLLKKLRPKKRATGPLEDRRLEVGRQQLELIKAKYQFD
mgnify:CR=1 FL=1